MSGFSGSPRLLKGAIIGLDPANPLASLVVFQYNPDTVTRTITPRFSGESGDAPQTLHFRGPPEEKISVELELDATDQLEKGMPPGVPFGVAPTLASLEMLLYPKTLSVLVSAGFSAAGMLEVIQPEVPLTLFVWNMTRIVPIRLNSLAITEEAFDTGLQPMRAKARIDMTVLTYQDLGLASAGGVLFMVHQVAKEVMATVGGTFNSISNLASGSFGVSIG
jgi:hypothetical protein